MIKFKNSVLNGLILTSERPIHPLVTEYLTRLGCEISYKDGYVILGGYPGLPNKKIIFAELIQLSKELYGEVNFDLDVKNTPRTGLSFEVVNKDPNKEPNVSIIAFKDFDQDIIDLLFIAYLLRQDAVVYLGQNKEICYMAGNQPLNKDKLIADATIFIDAEITRLKMQQGQVLEGTEASPQNFEINDVEPEFYDLLMFKYFLDMGSQIAMKENITIYVGGNIPHDAALLEEQIDEYIISRFLQLQSKGMLINNKEVADAHLPVITTTTSEVMATIEESMPAVPGFFASFSNWIWGGANNLDAPKITPSPSPRP